VQLMEPMSRGGCVNFPAIEPRRLVAGLYSDAALELVKTHVVSVLDPWKHRSMDYPVHMALAEAGDLYATAAQFGYRLRWAESRHRMEKLVDDDVQLSLSDYISNLGPNELELASMYSKEAKAAMRLQTASLFGSLRHLWKCLLQTITDAGESISPYEAVTDAVKKGKVKSVILSVGDVRRLVMEGIAFGALLKDAEMYVDSIYRLPSRKSSTPVIVFGASVGFARRLPGFPIFGS